jgi:serine/threonine protein kinase
MFMRSDICSLGATLYYLLSRQDPWQFHFSFPPLSRFNSAIPPRFEALVMKCLARRREARFNSAAEVLEELKGVEKELSLYDVAKRKEMSWAFFLVLPLFLFLFIHIPVLWLWGKICVLGAMIALIRGALLVAGKSSKSPSMQKNEP